MNRILQCRKVPILAPRRFLNPKRVGKIGEKKEILKEILRNLDDEIFNQIDVYGTEDIKTQIHKLQNTVTETTVDE